MNLDLFKNEHHSPTAKFLGDMNCEGFHHLISLPSRITTKSATLIDNIFTNDICTPVSSGLIFTTISDHLPVFAVFGDTLASQKGPEYIQKRVISDEGKRKFSDNIEQWGSDYFPGPSTAVEDSCSCCSCRNCPIGESVDSHVVGRPCHRAEFFLVRSSFTFGFFILILTATLRVYDFSCMCQSCF